MQFTKLAVLAFLSLTAANPLPEEAVANDACRGLIGNCYDNGCDGNPTTLVCLGVSGPDVRLGWTDSIHIHPPALHPTELLQVQKMIKGLTDWRTLGRRHRRLPLWLRLQRQGSLQREWLRRPQRTLYG